MHISSQLPISFSRVAWSILDCARRTSTFLSCAFREQEDGQAALPILLRPRVARAQKIIRLHPSSVPGSQDQCGYPVHPFHRGGGSASKKGTWNPSCGNVSVSCPSSASSRAGRFSSSLIFTRYGKCSEVADSPQHTQHFPELVIFRVDDMKACRPTGLQQWCVGTDDGQPQGLEFQRQRQV